MLDHADIRQCLGKSETDREKDLDGCVAVQGGVFASKQGFYDAVGSCRRNAGSEDKAALDRLTTFLHAH